MSKITTARRKRGRRKKKPQLYLGGIVALGIFVAVFILLSIIIVIIYVNSTKGLGRVLHPTDYDEYVYEYSETYNVDPNLVFAVIKTESNFDPNAESHAGALGLMQIMPETFEWLQTYKNGEASMGSEYLYEPQVNIEYGCIFLEFLLDKYSDEESAVAAYNAGFGTVDNWLADESYSTDGETLSNIPYPETKSYVKKVMLAKYYYENNGEINKERD
ncbi:MAG: lytic transglycosylase domain-containing protein [Acutalibacteraceae bacterium]|nr:lytic transglycosylase domain-containing protein [Acutalibacteraceae bacterium]